MPPKKKKTNNNTAPSTEMINSYELPGVKQFQKKHINPNYKNHGITVPFRGILIGSSGSGKTNLLLNLINQMPNTFNHIYVYTQAQEPIYDFLQEELGDVFSIYYSLDKLREADESKWYGQSLIVLDDMVNEKDQRCISEMYIRGRKIQGGISLLYLTQSYFKVPKTVRLQTQYIFILKVAGARDLNMILSEYGLSTTKDKMLQMYNHCCNRNIFGDLLLFESQLFFKASHQI